MTAGKMTARWIKFHGGDRQDALAFPAQAPDIP
jgi:hypothetical protein